MQIWEPTTTDIPKQPCTGWFGTGPSAVVLASFGKHLVSRGNWLGMLFPSAVNKIWGADWLNPGFTTAGRKYRFQFRLRTDGDTRRESIGRDIRMEEALVLSHLP